MIILLVNPILLADISSQYQLISEWVSEQMNENMELMALNANGSK
jgi:hypothetical protein